MLFVFSSSFHQETFTHTPFKILLCRSCFVLSCSWLRNWTPCVQKLHYWRQSNRAIALSFALLISMQYKWFTHFVNHLNSIESTLKTSDLIENEIFQPLTLRSQNSITRWATHHNNFHHVPCIYNNPFPNSRYILSHVGQFLTERNLRIHKKPIITMIWHRYRERNTWTRAWEHLQEGTVKHSPRASTSVPVEPLWPVNSRDVNFPELLLCCLRLILCSTGSGMPVLPIKRRRQR